MKNKLIITLVSVLAIYLCYITFFKSTINYPTQISNKVSRFNKENGQPTIESSKAITKGLAVDFVPDKETLLIANESVSKVNNKAEDKSEQRKPQSANYGVTEGVDLKANAQVASVAEALKNTKYPERLSPLVQPKPFDRAQFEKDPQAYLNVIEPGRVFQSRNPDAGVLAIQRISEAFVSIPQNDKTVLKVKALPFMPVSFTSFDLGAFQNKLTAITVQADKEGFAEATFVGTEGTIAECNILASCPETSGRVKFVITITKNNLFSQEK